MFYILPVTVEKRYDVRITGRVKRYDIMEAEKYLSKTSVNIDDVLSKLESGATVIASEATHLLKLALPTPWMIIHAIFDNDKDTVGGDGYFGEEFWAIKDFLTEDFWDLDDWSEFQPENNEKWKNMIRNSLTMKSAKLYNNPNERPPAVDDRVAEIMTQEVATSTGFHVNIPDDLDEVDKEKLRDLVKLVKSLSLREKMADYIRGKLVVVSVFVRL